jgi:hypothetical protein
MEGRYYRTVGLQLSTWRLIDTARSHPVFLEVYGPKGDDSDALTWLMRQGMIRLETSPLFNPKVETVK